MNDKDLLTIKQTSDLLGVSIQTLRRWDTTERLKSVRTKGGQRRYLRADVKIAEKSLPNFLFRLAKKWISESRSPALSEELYCANSAIFQTRLHQMEGQLSQVSRVRDKFSLIAAVAGEIGNNSFDHNLGNWPDVPGVFFSYDLSIGEIILADRGQGILSTLRRVIPELSTDEAALEAAFSRIVSGRAPESRGNGLKFVRQAVVQYGFKLYFRSGRAVLLLQSDGELNIKTVKRFMRGCLVKINF